MNISERAANLLGLIPLGGIDHSALGKQAVALGLFPLKHYDQTLAALFREMLIYAPKPRFYRRFDLDNKETVFVPEELSVTDQVKFARVRRKLELDMEHQLHLKSMEANNKIRRELLGAFAADYRRLMAWQQQNKHSMLTTAQHKLLRMALHPDSNLSDEKRNEAFRIFEEYDPPIIDDVKWQHAKSFNDRIKKKAG